MDSGGVFDASQGSHAQASLSATEAAATNYRQIGVRSGAGRLLLGAAHSYHASSVAAVAGAGLGDGGVGLVASVPSIPSRFETVLYSGEQEADAFLSRVRRFKPVARDLPGPGSYAAEEGKGAGSLEMQSTSFSSKGYGVGFVSKAERFKRRGGGPGPGAHSHEGDTIQARTAGSANRGSAYGVGTAAFRLGSSAVLDPRRSREAREGNQPGPTTYSSAPTRTIVLTAPAQRKLAQATKGNSASASALAAALQASLGSLDSALPAARSAAGQADPAFNTRDARFRSVHGGEPGAPIGGGLSGPGPAGYRPNLSAITPNPNAHTGLFKSQTHRTDFTASKAEVPGPGAYQEEKTSFASDDVPTSPTRAFKLTGVDRFGRVLEPRLTREQPPGPGTYEVPSFSSPPHGGFASPLAASLAHQQRAASPTAAVVTKRPPRAAGVGGPGKSLLATRGGAGVALNSQALVSSGPVALAQGTFGRAGFAHTMPSPANAAVAALANRPQLVTRESDIRPPGPAYHNPAEAFHHVHDKKEFHLNTTSRWM